MKTIRKALGGLVLLLAAATAGSALAAPNTLPDLGSTAADKAAQAQIKLKKDAVCTRCHDETESAPVLNLYQSKHGVRGDARTPSCQSCHGESDAHVKSDPKAAGAATAPDGSKLRPPPDVTFKKGSVYKASDDKARAGSCLSCHEGGNRTHWDGGQHQMNGVACNDCHQVHRPKDRMLVKETQPETCYGCHKKQRAETHRISTHPIDTGKVVCSDCHNPHGSTGPKLVKKNTVNETCFSCHAEKRGPFLWQHASANDDCTNCHTPHGSTVAPLLKARGPWLCQQCHGNLAQHPGNVYSGAGLPGGPVANVNPTNRNNPPVQLSFRGCVNCHQAVHGSNHPGGAYLLR